MPEPPHCGRGVDQSVIQVEQNAIKGQFTQSLRVFAAFERGTIEEHPLVSGRLSPIASAGEQSSVSLKLHYPGGHTSVLCRDVSWLALQPPLTNEREEQM